MSQNNFSNCNFNSSSVKIGDAVADHCAAPDKPPQLPAKKNYSSLYLLGLAILVVGGVLFMTLSAPSTMPAQVPTSAKPAVGQATLEHIMALAMKLPDKEMTLKRDYTYQAGEDDSKKTSRIKATQEIKRLLLEEMGNYISSETLVSDGLLENDTLYSAAAGVIKISILEEKWDGQSLWIEADLKANPRDILLALHAQLKNNSSNF